MPAHTSSRIFSGVAVTGPSVQTIFARRLTAHRLTTLHQQDRREAADPSLAKPSDLREADDQDQAMCRPSEVGQG
jgi:hypothetical protein